MAEPLPLTERELRFVRALVNHQVRFLVLPLVRILVSKRAANRPKNRLVVRVLEEVVALQAARARPSGREGQT